jgi:hypothetical protein
MSRGKRRDERTELHARLASRLLDDALHVFGALQACAEDYEPQLDDGLQGLLRTIALDLLDDVTSLAGLVATVPAWPSWPREVSRRPPVANAPAICAAVDDLADYSRRLDAIAIVLTNRRGEAAATFARLAAAAEARMALLGSP